MTKTICDVCNKEMVTEKYPGRIEDYHFCISSYGKAWDLCNDCREELNQWLKRHKSQKTMGYKNVT